MRAGGRACNCPVRLSRPDLAWERNGFLVSDGPALLTKKGLVFISHSASASASDAHRCMGLLWADASADLLVRRARDHRNIVGDPLNDPNRHACVQPFGGRTDGLPDLGGPVADGLFFEASST